MRSLALLRKSLIINGAGEGNRTLISGLGSPHSTTEPHPLPGCRLVSAFSGLCKPAFYSCVLVQAHAGFHFLIREPHVVDQEFKVWDTLLLNEEHFFLNAQFASQPDPTTQPDFDFMPERQVNSSRQL